ILTFSIMLVEKQEQYLPAKVDTQGSQLISLPTYQHGDDKEEANQHFIPGKAFLKKEANKDR
ncbi:hypothetical protein OSK62_27915, partial [Escherichia coli]|nr:hypothetical protein [Escherichia coli]